MNIGNIYVISPVGIGDKRWQKIEPELKSLFPDTNLERINVGKNHLDFSDSRHAGHIDDDRNLWTRFRLRLGARQNIIVFAQYDYFFRVCDAPSIKSRRLFPGELACSLAHLLAWQKIEALNTPDTTCLVIEDDAMLNAASYHDQDNTSRPDSLQTAPEDTLKCMEYPPACDLLHLDSERLYNHTPVGENLLRLLPCDRATPVHEKMNWTTLAYVTNPSGARKLLAARILSPCHPIDLTLLNRAYTPPLNLYATRQSVFIQPDKNHISLVHNPAGRRLVENIGAAMPYLLILWQRLLPGRLRKRIKRYLYHRE